MGMWVGRGRKARAAYGFDDIALVPGSLTINPNEVDISWELCGRRFQIPIMAAAMDGVVSPKLAIEMGRLGGLAVLNLEGIFSRYENPDEVLELMECGVDALLIGVGPGAACTSREVLGLGVPQVTATADSAAARDFYYKRTGRYVPIITDGGMTTGGDICKAFASGADAVMIGSAFARAQEAPGRGYHWGMATPHSNLPRGTRIRVGVSGTLEQILFGPAFTEDGTLNLVGAIRTCMGSVGARTIRELQQTELIIAPSIKTEGKVFQRAQKLGTPR